MPNMGTNKSTFTPSGTDFGLQHRRPSLADALFSSTQKRVLGLLFGQPERSFYANEIIDRLGAGSGAVQRELKKLAESGLLTVTRVGNQKHFQANPDSPIYGELRALVRKTVGLADPLREALEPGQKAIELALVYGSVAKGQEVAASDVDLLLVSDTLTLEAVYRLLSGAEQALGRKINPTLYTPEEFERRLREGNPFLTTVLAGDHLTLVGDLPGESQRTREPRSHRHAQG
jgi:predicted nucleotidyltransferase